MSDTKNIIAHRAAQELKDGQVINLGIGVPTLVANHVPPGWTWSFTARTEQWEVGPAPGPLCGDPDRGMPEAPITLIAGEATLTQLRRSG